MRVRCIFIFVSLVLFAACSAEKRVASVYICTGNSDDTYHCDAHCEQLRTCDGDVGEVTTADALEIGLHPCPKCYPPDSIKAYQKKHQE